ncbi:MAG: hypothetical protein H6Q02_2421 [Acidobacteria bacterium]|nr:hypothetical protein [Acidobacteriota bacterium]
MPTASPRRLTSGPPELPKLIAASVWMKFSNEESERPSTRPLAETMPTVTVWSMFNGLPTAITHSPTRSRCALPRFRYGNWRSGLVTLSRAMSVAGSRPTTSTW